MDARYTSPPGYTTEATVRALALATPASHHEHHFRSATTVGRHSVTATVLQLTATEFLRGQSIEAERFTEVLRRFRVVDAAGKQNSYRVRAVESTTHHSACNNTGKLPTPLTWPITTSSKLVTTKRPELPLRIV